MVALLSRAEAALLGRAGEVERAVRDRARERERAARAVRRRARAVRRRERELKSRSDAVEAYRAVLAMPKPSSHLDAVHGDAVDKEPR